MSETWIAEDDDADKAMCDEIAYDVWTSEYMEAMEAIWRRSLQAAEGPTRDIKVVTDTAEIKEQ